MLDYLQLFPIFSTWFDGLFTADTDFSYFVYKLSYLYKV